MRSVLGAEYGHRVAAVQPGMQGTRHKSCKLPDRLLAPQIVLQCGGA